MIQPIIYNGESAKQLFGERAELVCNIQDDVKRIIADVRNRGDQALREYSAKYDGYFALDFSVEAAEFEQAENDVCDEYKDMLSRAANNIREFHTAQKRKGFEIKDGNRTVGQKVVPISKVGIYIPAGTAAYPSTVLMNAIPAKVAGVGEVIMATPVKGDGKVKPEVLVAAKLCGVDRVLKMGGAQAIAALAYGTESVPKVDKITGPGNVYVAEAKRQVSGAACGIDIIAGPSEILVVADRGANARHVAADMLSQAEHDINASALLICDDIGFANAVISSIYEQVGALSRSRIALASIERNCKVIVADNIQNAVALANEYSPEHLELCVKDPFALLDKVTGAGSVFLGYDTPEATGDYYAGANHTLPTGGTARFSSPLGVDDFVKNIQYIHYTRDGLRACAKDITAFALSEGLQAHANSVQIRQSGE